MLRGVSPAISAIRAVILSLMLMASDCHHPHVACECRILLDGVCSFLHSTCMTEAQKLAARIRALSGVMGVEPSTLSRKLLGNGKRLDEIEAGGSVTLATFARVTAEIDEMSKAAKPKAPRPQGEAA